jgi:hypothetical protein
MSLRFVAPLFVVLAISMTSIAMSQAGVTDSGSPVSECKGKTAAEWNTIAEEKYKESNEVDTYRLDNFRSLSEEQQARLKQQAEKLDDEAHFATANAMGATLNGIGAPTDCQQ